MYSNASSSSLNSTCTIWWAPLPQQTIHKWNFKYSKIIKTRAYTSKLYDFLNTSKCFVIFINKDNIHYWSFSGRRALVSPGSSCHQMISSDWNKNEVFISFQNKSSHINHRNEDLCTSLYFFISSFGDVCISHFYSLCVCPPCPTACKWRTENSLQKLVLSSTLWIMETSLGASVLVVLIHTVTPLVFHRHF